MLVELFLKEYAEQLQYLTYTNKTLSKILQETLNNLNTVGLASNKFKTIERYSLGIDTLNYNFNEVSKNLNYCFMYCKHIYFDYIKLIISTILHLDKLEFNSYSPIASRFRNCYSLPVKNIDKIEYTPGHYSIEENITFKDIPNSNPQSLFALDGFYVVEGSTNNYTLKINISAEKEFNIVGIKKYNLDDVVYITSNTAYIEDEFIITQPTKSIDIYIKTEHFISGLYNINVFDITFEQYGQLNYYFNIDKPTNIKLNYTEPFDTLITTSVYKNINTIEEPTFIKMGKYDKKEFTVDYTEKNTIYNDTSFSGCFSGDASYISYSGVCDIDIGYGSFYSMTFPDETNLTQIVQADINNISEISNVGALIPYDINKFDISDSDILLNVDSNAFYVVDSNSYQNFSDLSLLEVQKTTNNSIVISINANSSSGELDDLRSVFNNENKLITNINYNLASPDRYLTYLTVDIPSSIKIDTGTAGSINIKIFEIKENSSTLFYNEYTNDMVYSLNKGIYLLLIEDPNKIFNVTYFHKDDLIKINAFNSPAQEVVSLSLLESAPNFNYYYKSDNNFYFKTKDTINIGNDKMITSKLNYINGDKVRKYNTNSNEYQYRLQISLLSNNNKVSPFFRSIEEERS